MYKNNPAAITLIIDHFRVVKEGKMTAILWNIDPNIFTLENFSENRLGVMEELHKVNNDIQHQLHVILYNKADMLRENPMANWTPGLKPFNSDLAKFKPL